MGICCSSEQSTVIRAESFVSRTQDIEDSRGTKEKDNVRYSMFINKKHFSQISEAYQLLEYLGKGAFGVVQKVVHLLSNDIRAMKTINRDKLSLTSDEKKLNREVEILKRLDHPNILKIYDFYYDSRNFYIITEFCRGGELFDKINELGAFSEKTAAIIIKQILQGIAYCHAKGIVHRDLKPENILIESGASEEVSIKIIDFGASSTFKSKQQLTEKTGTVRLNS